MLLSTLWTWITTKLGALTSITAGGAWAFSSTTRPTSSGTGTPGATSLITRADADSRYVDLSSSQVASGIKKFTDSISIGSTTTTSAKLTTAPSNLTISSALDASLLSSLTCCVSQSVAASSILCCGPNVFDRGVLYLIRSRGSTAAPSAVQNNDQIGDFLFGGFDGLNTQNSAGLFAYVDGSVSNGVVPIRLSFVTGNSAGSRAERLTVKSSGGIGIGNTSPDTSAMLDIASTTKGFLPPRMTTAQRDGILTPATGLMVYNTSTNKINFYTGAAWEAVTSA